MRSVRVVDVFLLGVATLLTLLMLALQAWTPQWWGALLATAFIVVATALHMTLGGSAKRIVRLTLIAFLIFGGPWFGYWYYSNFPASSKIMQAWFPAPTVARPKAAVATPIAPKRKTEATAERAIYKCRKAEVTDKKIIDANSAEFKKYIEVYADTFGYTAKVSDVPGGNKAELTPSTVLGHKNMGNALKITFEVRKIGKDLLGIYTAEFPQTIWSGYLLDQDSDLEKRIRKRIEDLVGVEPGDCELQ